MKKLGFVLVGITVLLAAVSFSGRLMHRTSPRPICWRAAPLSISSAPIALVATSPRA